VFPAITDPKRCWCAKREEIPPYLNFAPLEMRLTRCRVVQRLSRKPQGIATTPAQELNEKLMETERVLTDAAGLPRRPWFQHQIYAPLLHRLRRQDLPGVREAIEEKHWDEASHEIEVVSAVLRNEAALLDEMTTILKK